MNAADESQSTDSVNRHALPSRTYGEYGGTEGRTQSLQDQGDHLTFLNAHENGGRKTTSWCDEHNRTLNAAGECRGCAADRKAAPRPIDVIDNKTRAANQGDES